MASSGDVGTVVYVTMLVFVTTECSLPSSCSQALVHVSLSMSILPKYFLLPLAVLLFTGGAGKHWTARTTRIHWESGEWCHPSLVSLTTVQAFFLSDPCLSFPGTARSYRTFWSSGTQGITYWLVEFQKQCFNTLAV